MLEQDREKQSKQGKVLSVKTADKNTVGPRFTNSPLTQSAPRWSLSCVKEPLKYKHNSVALR